MAGDDALKPSSSGLSLAFGDPLYLHHNDIGGSPIVTVKLTAGAIYAKSTYELWNDLKESYDKVYGFAIFNLHTNINSLTQSGSSLAEYYNKLNSLWKQFDAMVSLRACTCEVAEHSEKHNQLIKLMQFLMGLYNNYLAIRSNILTREPLPLVKAAFAIVSGEESHRNITSNRANKTVAIVFAAKFVDKKKENNNNNYNKWSNSNSRGPNSNLKCTNCNKIRHTVDRCLEIVGYPAGYVKKNFIPNSRPVTSNNTTIDPQSNNANSNAASKSLVSLSNEQLTRLINLLNDNGVSSANANMSGANQHMTVFAKFLTNVVNISNLGLTVGHSNRTQSLISKIRDLKLNDNITLYDVLVVPEYTVSLLFVHKLLRDNKLFVGFNEILDVLKSSLNLDSQTTSEHLCNTCNKAKQTREPFPLSDHKSSKIGELVHLDVWGPYKITSRDGFRYSLTIVDDFTRVVWVYILKGKDDIYDFIIITDLPPGRKYMGNKWIYKIKYKSSGDIDRYKARLVVKSCSKKESVDFDETFSPVVKMSTIRCLIALSVTDNWPLFQLDVNNAFLYGDIDEDIYMTIPIGFASKENNNKVCKLVKSLYGLKQAPRKWNEKLVTILK
nr:ribonuclease H-like domain-containing protein [Tanacetum cinerariifolium]